MALRNSVIAPKNNYISLVIRTTRNGLYITKALAERKTIRLPFHIKPDIESGW